nr:hypothetical protein [Bacteroidota bacterium]
MKCVTNNYISGAVYLIFWCLHYRYTRIRDLGTVDFVPQEISHYFVEMRKRIHDCKFNNCLHENENNCAIKQAVADGEIHPSRYYNYLSMLHNEDNYK